MPRPFRIYIHKWTTFWKKIAEKMCTLFIIIGNILHNIFLKFVLDIPKNYKKNTKLESLFHAYTAININFFLVYSKYKPHYFVKQ